MAPGEETKAKASVLLQLRRRKTKEVGVLECSKRSTKVKKASQGELSGDRQRVILMSYTENGAVYVLSKHRTGEIPPWLVGVGFSWYLEEKNFLDWHGRMSDVYLHEVTSLGLQSPISLKPVLESVQLRLQ